MTTCSLCGDFFVFPFVHVSFNTCTAKILSFLKISNLFDSVIYLDILHTIWGI